MITNILQFINSIPFWIILIIILIPIIKNILIKFTNFKCFTNMKKSSYIVLGLRLILLVFLIYCFWGLIPSVLLELDSFIRNKKELVDTKTFQIIISFLFFGFGIATLKSIYKDHKSKNEDLRTIGDLYIIYLRNYSLLILICSLILHYVGTKIDLSLSCGLSLFIGCNIDDEKLRLKLLQIFSV